MGEREIDRERMSDTDIEREENKTGSSTNTKRKRGKRRQSKGGIEKTSLEKVLRRIRKKCMNWTMPK